MVQRPLGCPLLGLGMVGDHSPQEGEGSDWGWGGQGARGEGESSQPRITFSADLYQVLEPLSFVLVSSLSKRGMVSRKRDLGFKLEESRDF